ncbi:MAG: zinc-binding dehydrogenase [Nitrospinota bacterium]
MKAMVLHEWNGALSLETVPDPVPGHGEVVLRVGACAPDQFDVTIRAGRAGGKLPLILGHEIAGEVVESGPGVEGWGVGDRAIVHAYLTCGRCRFCQVGRVTLCRNFEGYFGVHVDGGYAEYVRAPARNLCRIPEGVGYAEATTIVSPVATPLKAIKTRAGVRPEDDVVIVGACGGVGIHAVQIAKAFGARVIAVDVEDGKLDQARKLGADHVVNDQRVDFAAEVSEITAGKGAEAVLELVGTEATLPKSFACLATAGTLVVIGFQPEAVFAIDPTRFVTDEIFVTGSRYVNHAELAEAAAWVEAGRVKPVISRTYPLAEAERALADLAANRIMGRAPIVPDA